MKNGQGKKIAVNAISASVQVVVVGLAYFFLYKYLINKLGVEQLGVWSLILSTSSIATLANFGITSGLVKFVADFNAKKKHAEIPELIFTAFVSVAGFYAILIAIIYLLASFIIDRIVDKEHIDIALKLLPFSLLSLFINEIGGVFTSVLEGYQKNYLRNIIYVVSTIIFLMVVFYLVPDHGLMGVAYAQVFQAALVMTGAFIFGSKVCGGINLFKLGWNKAIFKQLISYGSKFQLVSIFQIMYEPVTKALLSKMGGLAIVGFYEMASRLINQARAFIVNANQVMIPVVAHAANEGKDEVKSIYAKSLSITLLVASILVSGVIALGSVISLAWIGHYEPMFIFSLNVLGIAIYINILCGPAYFGALGEGKLNLLMISSCIMACLIVVLGYMLGLWLGGTGVIIAWGITLSTGTVVLIYYYQRSLNAGLRDVLNRSDMVLLCCTLVYISINLILGLKTSVADNITEQFIKNSLLYIIIILPAVAYSKSLRQLISQVRVREKNI